ncbi:MAG: hypothetical protein JKY50_10360 [Oleispira sp.]|nr:hypothetical protein [Oleispira sp.]
MKSTFFVILQTCLIILFSSKLLAEDIPSLVVRNVVLLDGREGKEDFLANILIYDYKLALVSKDNPPMNDSTKIIDAEGGFLLGNLHLGKPVTFLVFDKDPRVHKEVLIDTKATAKLVVYHSAVITNLYPEISIEDIPASEKKPPRGWLAYTPPPLALSTSYLDTRKWNRWQTKYVDGIFVAASIMDSQNWFHQNSASEDLVGDLEEYNTGQIRALRFGAVGTINTPKKIIYTVFASTNAFNKDYNEERDDNFSWLDWRLDIPLAKDMSVSLGKQKEPIGLERTMSLVFLDMQERTAASDALLRSRNVGIVVNGSLNDSNVRWGVGLFNDWFEEGEDYNESSNQLISRISTVIFESEESTELLHLGGGFRYDDGKEGYRFSTRPEFNNSPNFVDTGTQEAEDIMTWQMDSAYLAGPLWLHGQYLQTNVNSSKDNDPSFSGYYVGASWALTGELRKYNKRSGTFGALPVAQTVYQGGWGAWSVGTRWSEVDLSDEAVDGGDMSIASVSLNWWLTPYFLISTDLRHVWHDQAGLNGESTGFNTRLLLILE